jgi:hypothetical protein
MEVREIEFTDCKSRNKVLQKIFKEYQEISVQEVKEEG